MIECSLFKEWHHRMYERVSPSNHEKAIQRNVTAVMARRTRCQLNYDAPFERKWLI